MKRRQTVLEKYLPPWAPLTPRFARVGDRVIFRRDVNKHTLAYVEDAALDRQRILVRPWVESRQAWGEKPRWIRRTDVVAVVSEAPKKPTTTPEGQKGT